MCFQFVCDDVLPLQIFCEGGSSDTQNGVPGQPIIVIHNYNL